MSVDQARQFVLHDLDPEFVETALIALAWEYDDLFTRLVGDGGLDDGYREEEFNERRGDCAVRALVRAARRHGVPFEFRRLDCNGQSKLLLKAGRVILIQEPIRSLSDHPAVADYKRDLADLHGFVRQLEFDFGDQPHRIRDWSGCVLAVLLHGSVGEKFTADHKVLGHAMLGIPDAAYQQWVLRLDLHTIAMFGTGSPERRSTQSNAVQTDNVVVTPKKRNASKDTA